MTLAVDASVGLRWVPQERDSHLAQAMATGQETLLVPDSWLNEACNVLWLQVRRSALSASEAREGSGLLRAQVEPTPTAGLRLHAVALEIGLAAGHSTYDIAMGSRGVVVADGPFVRGMRRHPDPSIAAMLIPLDEWARDQGMS